MATNTPLEIVQSYQDLLIMQYVNLPKASATIANIVSQAILPQVSVQEIDFSLVATSGTFVLSYNGNNTASINWNDSVSTIQTKLQAVTGLSSVTVTGSIASQALVVTFTGVIPPALSLIVVSSSLVASATSISLTITETDVTLPIAIQNGFNLIQGTPIAVGVQLDILGQYVGVSRTGAGFTTSITLDDADFYQLIQMAIIKNSSGSSLATITDFLNQFFGSEIVVYDNQDMTMTYVISSGIGSQNLIELFISEDILPAPMAVETTVFNPPSSDLFSFRTAQYPNAVIGVGFNTATSAQLGYWLDTRDLIL